MVLGYIIGGLGLVTLASSIRIVRPMDRGAIERFGKYNRFASSGLYFIIPLVEQMYKIDISERMVDAKQQEIITADNLNAIVDAQVYFKVKADEVNVKASLYNVEDYEKQIVSLARTTLRNIVGTMSLREANSQRNRINDALKITLKEETKNWGIDIVRTELKEINPPADVQETMNKVVKAENEKISAIDFATAVETRADGEKRAEIKKAEGIRQSKILEAQGEAEAIKVVNESAEKYFRGNAQLLKKLETIESAFKDNTKIIVPSDKDLTLVMSEMAGITPIKKS